MPSACTLRSPGTADARAQQRPAITHARKRREAAALELQLHARAAGREQLAEQNRPPVAELARPVAELVAAIDARQRTARQLARCRTRPARRWPSSRFSPARRPGGASVARHPVRMGGSGAKCESVPGWRWCCQRRLASSAGARRKSSAGTLWGELSARLTPCALGVHFRGSGARCPQTAVVKLVKTASAG